MGNDVRTVAGRPLSQPATRKLYLIVNYILPYMGNTMFPVDFFTIPSLQSFSSHPSCGMAYLIGTGNMRGKGRDNYVSCSSCGLRIWLQIICLHRDSVKPVITGLIASWWRWEGRYISVGAPSGLIALDRSWCWPVKGKASDAAVATATASWGLVYHWTI